MLFLLKQLIDIFFISFSSSSSIITSNNLHNLNHPIVLSSQTPTNPTPPLFPSPTAAQNLPVRAFSGTHLARLLPFGLLGVSYAFVRSLLSHFSFRFKEVYDGPSILIHSSVSRGLFHCSFGLRIAMRVCVCCT